MKKHTLQLLSASSLLLTLPFNATALTPSPQHDTYQLAYNMSSLIDVPSDHWAYKAVKYLLEELEIMTPKYKMAFMGNLNLTRYELAEVFYRAMKRLEKESGVDLTQLIEIKPQTIPDTDSTYKEMVNAVVNKYGIMLLIHGNFYGDISISRYEIAFELANYFTLIEKSAEKLCKIVPRTRAHQLKDLDPNHWTYGAVKGIIDQHQLMDGYDDNTFRGDKPLSRFEGAAVITKFVQYVDKCYKVKPKPTPTPTPTPTPPEPSPTPIPRTPNSIVEFKLNMPYQMSQGNHPFSAYPPYVTGGQGETSLWFGHGVPIGISLGGEYLLSDAGIPFLNQATATIDYTSRWRFSQAVQLRLWGARYRDEFKWTIGVGNDFTEFTPKNGLSRQLSGPFVKMGMEIPLGTSYVGLLMNASAAHYNNWNVWDPAAVLGNIRADGFMGLVFPAYGWGSFFIGGNVVYYSMPHLNNNTSVLEIGPQLGFALTF